MIQTKALPGMAAGSSHLLANIELRWFRVKSYSAKKYRSSNMKYTMEMFEHQKSE
jgi:hypothetical protein